MVRHDMIIVIYMYYNDIIISVQVSCLVPPKHDPVVIKLGEDSDSEESGASDSEIGPKAESSNQKSGGSLFGGLEMMIKEARKSAEVRA